jgi:phospholipid/cholesterol/gamma-HCH transport system substrate-binding protein
VKQAIKKRWKDFVAILVLVVLAVFVAGYILTNQGFTLPGWVPVIGTDVFTLKAQFQTAQAVTPGQGQSVDIAGVKVGEITEVNLVDGRAVVTMTIDPDQGKDIRTNAQLLLRPKTGLKDMVISMKPGSAPAPFVKENSTLPIANTLPDVNPDQFLATLDVDTRDYLKLLLGGAGQGLKGNGKTLSATLRRFEPTARDILQINELLSQRTRALQHVVTNFQKLSTELSTKDNQISQLVDNSAAVFRAFASQDQNIRETLRLLPGSLQSTNDALGKVDTLARQLGPALERLRPGARALGPSLLATQPFFRDTVPVFKNQLGPFATSVTPIVRRLKPVTQDLAELAPNLTKALGVLNTTFNELAYNPPGAKEGFLFFLAWANHAGASIFNFQDAHGPIRRGIIIATCETLNILPQVGEVNPNLQNLLNNTNLPIGSPLCPPAPGAASAKAKAAGAAPTGSQAAPDGTTTLQQAPALTPAPPAKDPAPAPESAPAPDGGTTTGGGGGGGASESGGSSPTAAAPTAAASSRNGR